MEALLEQEVAEPGTEPRIGIPTLCGVRGCVRAASPGLLCRDCGMALCQRHAHPWYMAEVGNNQIFCPTHKKGGG